VPPRGDWSEPSTPEFELGAELVVVNKTPTSRPRPRSSPSASTILGLARMRHMPSPRIGYCTPDLTVKPLGCHPRPAVTVAPHASARSAAQRIPCFHSQAYRSTRQLGPRCSRKKNQILEGQLAGRRAVVRSKLTS